MAMDDDEPRNAESKALSLSFKWLKANTDLEYIISFSDGKENNVGYIYQATNWTYLGYLISSSFFDLDGEIKHAVTIWHQYKENDDTNKTTNELLCEKHDNVSVLYCKQHLYVYRLNRNVKFKFEGVAYPKLQNEVPILKRKWIKQNGIMNNTIDIFSDVSGSLW